MFREICAISEIHCDDYTLKNIKGAERKKYSNLLINLSTESFKKPEKHYVVHLVSYNVKLLERRIQEMKMPEKKKHIILACLTGGLICIIGGIPSFAYIPPSVYVLNAQVSNLSNPLESERTVYSDFDIQSVIEHIPYNYYWQGDDGSIIQLDYRQKAESSPSCTHDHIAGTIIKHIQNNDDSCKVSYTEGERCILCGKITEGKEVNVVHYGICPHEMTISEME